MVLSLLCTFVAHITFLHVFFLLPPFILSLSLAFSFSLSLFLSLSLYLCPLFLSVVARHMSSDALYQIFSSWSILLFHTISFHSSYKIHQLFTDYLLRLPSSELLEKHLFRSRANRRLVRHLNFQKWSGAGVFCAFWLRNALRATTACTFSSLIWPDGSAPAALASLLFDPPEPQISGKTQCVATFLPFRASASSFFWLFLFSDLLSSTLLFSLTLSISAFHLSILSEVWLLNFLR